MWVYSLPSVGVYFDSKKSRFHNIACSCKAMSMPPCRSKTRSVGVYFDSKESRFHNIACSCKAMSMPPCRSKTRSVGVYFDSKESRFHYIACSCKAMSMPPCRRVLESGNEHRRLPLRRTPTSPSALNRIPSFRPEDKSRIHRPLPIGVVLLIGVQRPEGTFQSQSCVECSRLFLPITLSLTGRRSALLISDSALNRRSG